MVLIKISDGKQHTYRFRKELKGLGFRFFGDPEPHWEALVSEDAVPGLEDWCFRKRLGIETPFSKRSHDYRKAFFDSHGPTFGKDRYLCVYCGWPVLNSEITVDHLISVSKAQRSKRHLNLLRKNGFESVNDVRNLVPCCKRCNSRKGAKAGLWVFRGLIGQKNWFWYTVWALEGFILLGVVALLYLLMFYWERIYSMHK